MDYFDEIDDIIDEEEEIMYRYISQPRRNREIRPRLDFDDYDAVEFRRRFRLSKETVQYLLSLIINSIAHPTQRNQAILPMTQLQIALRFYATGSFYITVGDFGGVHSTTVCGIVRRVTRAIASLRPTFLKLPTTMTEIARTQADFYTIARFPRVISAIDCTHVRIQSPGGNTAEDFRNRKGFFSLNVQAMCTSNLIFQDIVARWPGAAHDGNIFSNSSAKFHCVNGSFGNGVILGDSGYELASYMMIPIRNPTTIGQSLYNESQIRTRNVIERCFGVWKRRFPVLSIGLRCKVPLIQDTIVACAVLHNLARMQNEEEPMEDPNVIVPPQPVFDEVEAPIHGEGEERCPTRNILVEYFSSLPQ